MRYEMLGRVFRMGFEHKEASGIYSLAFLQDLHDPPLGVWPENNSHL